MSAPAQLPFEQTHPLQVPPQLRTLRSQGSIHRVRSAHPLPETSARTGEPALFSGLLSNFETEPADHARTRSLLQPYFTPKRMRTLRPKVDIAVARLLDELAKEGPPADLHTALALPLAILVICELLGVPHEDRDKFRTWIDDASNTRNRARSEQALGELLDYGQRLVAGKRRNPGDDIISRLCTAEGVSSAEAVRLPMALLFAGHETTVVQIGLGALLLLTNPDLWLALLDDPGLVENAVEDILRTTGSGDGGLLRYARTDPTVDGVTIPAGDLVLLDSCSANHDPAVLPNPHLADVTRPAAAHLLFGNEPRPYIGTPLARIALEAVFTQLVPRFPAMRLAVYADELRMRRDVFAGGLVELPVWW